MNPLFLLLGFFGTGSLAAASFGSNSGSKQVKTLSDIDDRPVGGKGIKKAPKADKNTNDNDDETSGGPIFEEPTPEEPVDPTPEQPEEPVAEDPVVPTPEQPEEPVAEDPVVPTPEQPEEPVAEDPADPEPEQPEEPTAEDPVVPTPEAPDQSGGSGSDGGETTPIIADGTVDVMTGRVATLEPSGNDIVELKIISGVEHGNITVNPDNTFALVMTKTDFTGMQSFTYEAVHADGSTSTHEVSLDVAAGAQEGGWGTSEGHYMLATDEDDRVIVEHGETHTKVYISGDSSALSLADIADQEDMSLSQVTGSWLAANGYGQSEDMALDQEAGMQLWDAVTPRGSETSNWLLLERGYEYDDLGERVLTRDTNGEDENHPLYIGAWGEGDRPEITTEFTQYQESSSNLVIQDIHFSGGFRFSHGDNIILDNIMATGGEVAIQRTDGVTIRNSEFIDIVEEQSADGGDWDTHSDRIQGLYMNVNDGVLLEGLLFDHNSWADGYQADHGGDGGQSPSMFSHNMYLDVDMTDVTMRDTITMRAASYGVQVRSGGFIEDNLLLDNNAAITFVGGDYDGAGPVGQYTLMTDNVITSGAHKEVDLHNGALTLGINDLAQLTSLVDNIVAHLADPNNLDEQQDKYWTHTALRSADNYYDDTIVWNWEAQQDGGSDMVKDQNTEGLDTAALDQTTIQLFTAQLLGDPNATIADLADYLRAQADGAFDDVVDADLIIRFFQEGFGIAPDIRDGDATLRFTPDELGEGVRWDNRMNWDTDDLPGLYSTDSVDLGGNLVTFGLTTEINTLDFGPGGTLNVYGGRLELNGGFTGNEGGTLNIEGAGQVWTDGSDAENLDINVAGGRFANTGEMQNADLTATGGETILATGGAEFDLAPSKTLAVFEAAAKVGFDGDDGGMAILDMHEGSTLAFEARDGDLGTIEEFRSGALGDNPDVLSGVDLGNATLSIDLSGLSADAGTAFTLMDTDEIVGIFNEATVDGLGAQDATVVIDYENDSVQLQLSAGNGTVTVETLGAMTDTSSGEQELWDALTSGQGVVSESAQVQVLDEDDLLDAAA